MFSRGRSTGAPSVRGLHVSARSVPSHALSHVSARSVVSSTGSPKLDPEKLVWQFVWTQNNTMRVLFSYDGRPSTFRRVFNALQDPSCAELVRKFFIEGPVSGWTFPYSVELPPID